MRKLVVTSHAVERFQLRVRPALTVDQARVELSRLVEVSEVVEVAPTWFHEGVPAESYALISDGVALVLNRGAAGRLCAVTCVCRCEVPAARRQRMNLKKAQRRRARRRRKLAERGPYERERELELVL